MQNSAHPNEQQISSMAIGFHIGPLLARIHTWRRVGGKRIKEPSQKSKVKSQKSKVKSKPLQPTRAAGETFDFCLLPFDF
jgi:hypothetical protein